MRTATTNDFFDFDFFISYCTSVIATGADLATYLQRYEAMADELFPAPPEGNLRNDPQLRRCLGLSLARAVWKQTPHPAHRYACALLPTVERNSLCHCGSGRKYKQCCQVIERDLPLKQVNLLPSLLESLPIKRWSELVGSRVEVARVEHAARQWHDAGDFRCAQSLLEPWFVDDVHFTARHEVMFDVLLDVYSSLPRPRKKSMLLDRAIAKGDTVMRSAALQRRASMAADLGDFRRAWALFAQAQRTEPESVSLSHLEVSLLLNEDRDAEAQDRAQYWLLRLQRRRDPQLEGLIGFLRDVAENGRAAFDRAMDKYGPSVR